MRALAPCIRWSLCYHMSIAMALTERDKSLRVRVAADELRMVQELAEADGLTASDYVRLFIRRAHAERFPAPKRRKTA